MGQLEAELRARRSEPPARFVRSLAAHVGSRPRWFEPRTRYVLLGLLGAAVLAAAASAGGLGLAKTSANNVIHVVDHLTGQPPGSGQVYGGNQGEDNQGGDSQGGDNNQGGNNQGGDNQGGDGQGGNNQGGNNQGGNNQGGNNQGGNNQGGGGQGGNNQGGDNQGGDGQCDNDQGGNDQDRYEQGVEGQGGDNQGGNNQGGNGQGGDGQGCDPGFPGPPGEDQYLLRCGQPPLRRCIVDVEPKNALIIKGRSGLSPVSFLVTLNGFSDGTVSINWATANGTATAPGDYVPANGNLNFSFGQFAQLVTVFVRGNTTHSPPKTFYVNFSSSSALIGPGSSQVSVTIISP